VEVAFDLNTQRIARLYKVLENHIDHVLVKDFNVPKRVDIEFETLQLDANLARNIFDSDGGEVRESENGQMAVNSGMSGDPDLASRKLIGKSLQG
jgi:hypothetical protein